MEILLVVVIAAIAIWAHSRQQTRKRREALMQKYNDAVIVDRIMAGSFWQGQTEEQLSDALGRPVDIDQRVMKHKIRETWKYQQQGKNRFGLRITLEDGFVVGWDHKA